ncbi:MAG: hypothetical protein ABIK07_05840 [Planctomycetota bacterium]|jgi:hypothetical protein|uniref:hypothetical protein n=1 Tax=uncultured Gimesia sp. TaxID=1678688 RepID=UPI002603EF63|nr:hypothetical protein [uncultured Gimesia sp.]
MLPELIEASALFDCNSKLIAIEFNFYYGSGQVPSLTFSAKFLNFCYGWPCCLLEDQARMAVMK